MKEFLSNYKTEVLIAIIVVLVMFVPYLIISSGVIKSEDTLLMVVLPALALNYMGQGALLMTDLDDRDVIKGGSNKLDRILDGVAKSAVRPTFFSASSASGPKAPARAIAAAPPRGAKPISSSSMVSVIVKLS